MCETEDVFWELHTVVTGVKGATDAAGCCVNGQKYPPCKGFGGAEVVRDSLIKVIFYKHTLRRFTRHQDGSNTPILFDTGAPKLRGWVGHIETPTTDTLDIALLGCLSDLQHELPPPRSGREEWTAGDIVPYSGFRGHIR